MKCVFAISGPRDSGGINFQLLEEDLPQPGQHEVLLEVKACALSEIHPPILNDVFKKKPRTRFPVGQYITGTVSQVGLGVTKYKTGDRVAGILPEDSSCAGCAECCVIAEYNLVRLPETISFALAAAALADGLRAYTALHYQAHVAAGETALIMDGASSSGSICIQLIHAIGAKVITTSRSVQEKAYLEKLVPQPAHIIEMGDKSNLLLSSVMEETGGLGVDVIIDHGVRLFTNEADSGLSAADINRYPVKHELLSCLAVGGRWVTSHHLLQLDPPDSLQLHLKRASVCFLNEHSWAMSCSQQGRLMHILRDILNHLESGALVLNIAQAISLSEVPDVMQSGLKPWDMGKIVMVNS